MGFSDISDMRPTIAVESIPPERNAPMGTSDCILASTEEVRVSRMSFAIAFESISGERLRFAFCDSAAVFHHRKTSVDSSCISIAHPASNRFISCTIVAGACTVEYLR